MLLYVAIEELRTNEDTNDLRACLRIRIVFACLSRVGGCRPVLDKLRVGESRYRMFIFVEMHGTHTLERRGAPQSDPLPYDRGAALLPRLARFDVYVNLMT